MPGWSVGMDFCVGGPNHCSIWAFVVLFVSIAFVCASSMFCPTVTQPNCNAISKARAVPRDFVIAFPPLLADDFSPILFDRRDQQPQRMFPAELSVLLGVLHLGFNGSAFRNFRVVASG